MKAKLKNLSILLEMTKYIDSFSNLDSRVSLPSFTLLIQIKKMIKLSNHGALHILKQSILKRFSFGNIKKDD